MDAFATLEDLKADWPGFDDSMSAQAASKLAFVSASVASLCDAGAVDAEVLKGVTLNAVERILQSSGELAGVTQESWGASPYSGSMSYANPTGDFYLTKQEKELLGITSGMTAAWVMQEPE